MEQRTNPQKELLEQIIKELEQMRDRIGDGSGDEDLSNQILENLPDTTMTGQAYEDLWIAYAALDRCYETVVDLVGENFPEEEP